MEKNGSLQKILWAWKHTLNCILTNKPSQLYNETTALNISVDFITLKWITKITSFTISETERLLNKIDRLPLHPRFKLELYAEYLLPKISWHLTIADINITWVKQSLNMLCHNKFREWLEIRARSTLDILFQAKSKFGLNIIDVSNEIHPVPNDPKKETKKLYNPLISASSSAIQASTLTYCMIDTLVQNTLQKLNDKIK